MPLYRFVLVYAYIPRAYFGGFVPEVGWLHQRIRKDGDITDRRKVIAQI